MAKGISKIIATLIVIVLLVYVAISGLTIGSTKIGPVFDDEHGVRKGFDLAGGSVIVYQAEKTDEGKEPTDAQMKVAKQILDGRLSRKGFTEGASWLLIVKNRYIHRYNKIFHYFCPAGRTLCWRDNVQCRNIFKVLKIAFVLRCSRELLFVPIRI